jgi:hypothetical protein
LRKNLDKTQVDGVKFVMTGYTKPYTSLRHEKSRIFSAKFRNWPPEISDYPALLDLVHWSCERINPTGGFFAYQRLPKALFTVAAERLRQDAIAGKYRLGVLHGGKFTPLDPRLLFAGDSWVRIFREGRAPSGHDLFVLDREMDPYVPALSRPQ